MVKNMKNGFANALRSRFFALFPPKIFLVKIKKLVYYNT